MAQKFKFRYVNELVGGFVLVVVLALLAGILLAGRAQHWFEAMYDIELKFPPEGSMELKEGAEVMLLGAKVGTVRDITVDEGGRISGSIRVRGPFMRFIKADSVAKVKKKLVVTGDAYIELSRGEGAELPRAGGEIVCVQDTEIIEMAMAMLEDLKANATKTLELVNGAIAEYTALAAGMNDPEGNLQQLLANSNGLLEDIRKGEGLPARVLNDPAMADSVAETLEEVNRLVANLNAMAVELQKTVESLPPLVDAVSGEVENLPVVVGDAQNVMRETTTMLQGLEKHWLLRKYMGSDDAVRAEEVIP